MMLATKLDTMFFVAAVSGILGCSPNLVVGMRAPDAAQPLPQPDAGLVDAMQPAAASDAGSVRDAAMVPPALEADANINAVTPRDAGMACATNDQCIDTDEPLCNVREGRCVECLDDSDCDPSELCEDDGECSARPIPCTSPLQCVGSGDPVCHPMLQVCVECAADSDCPRSESCQTDNECD